MKNNLLVSALTKLLAGLVLFGLLLFLPAGTIYYPNAWLLIALLFIPMALLGIVMLKKAPGLLAKRLQSRESESEQKTVVALSALMFIASFILAGLDFRFGWSRFPHWLTVIAAILFLVSYGLYAEVMRENAWLSRTIEVQENQKVVDTGLYGLVRHPMYFATILLFLSMPLVLGSVPALICLLPYPVVIARRIQNEEEVLEKGLQGYSEYKQRVRYKILPFIW